MISNTNGSRKGKKRQNDQRCNLLARVKLENEGISRHGRNTRDMVATPETKETTKIFHLHFSLMLRVSFKERKGFTETQALRPWLKIF